MDGQTQAIIGAVLGTGAAIIGIVLFFIRETNRSIQDARNSTERQISSIRASMDAFRDAALGMYQRLEENQRKLTERQIRTETILEDMEKRSRQ